MRRRTLLGATAAALAAPAVLRAAAASVLKFVPQSDLPSLDPIWTTADVTRNHGFMVYDTLYGQQGPDHEFQPSLQMLAGHSIEQDGRLWRLTLRDGLRFHDNEPVLARDCVASVQRWGKRDSFGQALMARTDEVSAPDDRSIVFRLKRPFPLLPVALAKSESNMCAMMPARIAATDPFKAITDVIGSGPFRYLASERLPGALVAYQRFDGYVPRADGRPDWTAGPKHVGFDRVEWHVIPDPATAAGAVLTGEVDWLERPILDLLPMLARSNAVKLAVQDPTGLYGLLRPNFLYPPFNNAAIRRAVMGAIDQTQFMTAAAGTDSAMWRAGMGFFPPISPLANDTDIQLLTDPRDYAAVHRALDAAGYAGEAVVLLAPTDIQSATALAQVAADTLHKAGMTVDYQAMDWATLVQRRALDKPPAQGGWNVFGTYFPGLQFLDPAGDLPLRGNGRQAWVGWPNFPDLERLREAWLDAPSAAARRQIGVQMQHQAFLDVPYWPVGLYYQPTAFRATLQGMLQGFPIFWNLRRTG
ncbi:MAG TPA: ABC transporter substrate-binding protein [Acetobacteraceae bacterium]|nr:ABC transporter substrate-binding protein [Acetobacteraceae bacterium]